MTSGDKDVRALDALNAERAADDAERAVNEAPTAAERAQVERLKARTAELLESQRATVRESLVDSARQRAAKPVPASILGMARDAVLARLREVMAAEPELALQFRELDELSDDDLRRLLADVEEQRG